jgi:hypothetical protein
MSRKIVGCVCDPSGSEGLRCPDAIGRLHCDPSRPSMPNLTLHIMPRVDSCEHDFQGWREFDGGHGGEQVCSKCGMGAMDHTLCSGF